VGLNPKATLLTGRVYRISAIVSRILHAWPVPVRFGSESTFESTHHSKSPEEPSENKETLRKLTVFPEVVCRAFTEISLNKEWTLRKLMQTPPADQDSIPVTLRVYVDED